MDYQNFERDDWLFIVLAVLLALAIMVLPWSQKTENVSNVFVTKTHTGIASTQGWLCLLAVLALLAAIAHLMLERGRPDADRHPLGGGGALARLLLVGLAAAFVAIWLIVHLGIFSQLQLGFWIGVVLTVALLVFAVKALLASSGPEPSSTGDAESATSD